MTKEEIKNYFMLGNNPQLFESAIHPPSCGGDAEFELLALYGDQIINMHLYDYLIDKGWKDKGQITAHKETIHKGSVIKIFAEEVLGVQKIMNPQNPKYSPKEKDISETVEALIGAAYKANDLEKCKSIVYSFVDFALDMQKKLRETNTFDHSQNYKGALFRLYQAAQLQEPDIEPDKVEWTDGTHTYQFDWQVIFEGKRYEICTQDCWTTKLAAQQEAAYIALRKITGEYVEYTKFDPAISMEQVQEKTVHPTTSIDSEELFFRKSDIQHESMEVDENTGELLIDYVNRKAQKNVFGMLKLISARLDTVSGASWTCEFSSGVLALINLQLGEQKYFALGFGPSKSKARTNAGNNMLIKVNLVKWLEENYPNHTI